MEQIKNYLSRHLDIKSAIVLGNSIEARQLRDWLKEKKQIEIVEEKVHPNGYWGKQGNATFQQNLKVDAIIFDKAQESQLFELAGVSARYLIGRMNKDENYFGIWEKYRGVCEKIYISKDKGLLPEQITPDIAPNEILEWEKGKTDIELSIILPVYNVEKYLQICLKTLTAWKASYVEFLFVNDGSSDQSATIIEAFSKNDSRVKLIHKENGGCASARNRGLENAQGRLIGFVDSDDFVDETMFQKLFARAIMGDYDLTYCGYQEYYEESKESEPVLNDCLKEPYLGGTYRKDKVELLSVNTRVAIWRCLYKKEILEKKQLRFHEDLKRFDDLPFRLEYIFAAKSAVCVPEHLYFYRLGRKGQDVACSDTRLYVHFPMFEYLDAYVDSFKDKRLQDLLQIVKIQTHGFALSKLESKYRRQYIKRARMQLNRNMGYLRTLNLILIYTGKGNIWWYTLMKLHLLF